MKRFSGIQRFLQLNNIDEKCLQKAAENLEVRFVKKNDYFIHEGEPTGFFAGVIKGKVSIRKTHIFNKITKEIEIKPLYKMVSLKKSSTIRKSHQKLPNDFAFLKSIKKSNSESIENLQEKPKESNDIKKDKKNVVINQQEKNNILSGKKLRNRHANIVRDRNFRIVKEFFDQEKYDFIEEELFRRGEGYCFGEWALIYKQPRSASIYTLEDCIFFTLDETPFKNSFLKSLNSNEFNKKKFALKNFLPFDMMDERQLSIYKNIVPINCKRNQIIFNEGDCSDSIYLIYLGSFTLEKKYGYKQFSVLNLEKGSIVGLESVFEGVKSKYKCSLKLSNGFDFGIIFKLQINKLRPYIINKMKISFKTNYNLFLNSWKELFKKNIYVRQSISRKLANKNIEETKKGLFLDSVENCEKEFDVFSSNYNSVLNIKKENKYENLFRKCHPKPKDFENRKKDGSLRIFSSKQRSKIYDKQEEIKDINNKKSSNVNLIKYFKEFLKKSEYDRKNLKTAHQLRTQKLNNLNYSDIFPSNNNTKRKTKKKPIYFKSDPINEVNRQNDEINQKYSKTENENIISDKSNVLLSPKFIKLNHKQKKIKFKVSKANDEKIKENERYKIENKKELIEDFDNNEEEENINVLSDNNIKNDIIIKKGNELQKNEELKNRISKINKNLLYKLNEKNHKSKTIQNYNLKERKISYKIKRKTSQNKTHIRNFINFSSNPNRTTRKNISSAFASLSNKNNNHKIRLLIKDDKNNAKKLFKKNYSQMVMDYHTGKENKTHFFRDTNKLQKNQSTYFNFDKQASDKLLSYQDISTFSGKKSNLFKEFNLNNGFSVSYFKNKKLINNFNNFEIIKKKPQFSSCSNKFKITFDSGDFNIPLVSSSLRLKRRKIE